MSLTIGGSGGYFGPAKGKSSESAYKKAYEKAKQQEYSPQNALKAKAYTPENSLKARK